MVYKCKQTWNDGGHAVLRPDRKGLLQVTMRFLICVLCILAAASCSRTASITLLLHNTHRGFDGLEMRLAHAPNMRAETVPLYSAKIPFNPGGLYAKTLQMPGESECCLAFSLVYRSEVFSESRGSYKHGKNVEIIRISDQGGGAYLVKHESGADMPADLKELPVIQLP